jgi:hypothetical protein
MGTGIAENRKQRSDAGTFQKEMETYANPLPMNCCKPPLPKQPAEIDLPEMQKSATHYP